MSIYGGVTPSNKKSAEAIAERVADEKLSDYQTIATLEDSVTSLGFLKSTLTVISDTTPTSPVKGMVWYDIGDDD